MKTSIHQSLILLTLLMSNPAAAEVLTVAIGNEDAGYAEKLAPLVNGTETDGQLTLNFLVCWMPEALNTLQKKVKTTFFIEQIFYSPSYENKRRSQPNLEDRPFSGWLGTGIHLQRRHLTSYDFLESLGDVKISTGFLGKASGTQQMQDYLHDVRGHNKHDGWDNLSESKIRFLFRYDHYLRFMHTLPGTRYGGDLLAGAGITTGTLQSAGNISAVLRAGKNLHGDFGPVRVNQRLHPLPYTDSRQGWNYNLFVGVKQEWILYDAFLEGEELSHSVRAENEVLEFQAGLQLEYKKVKLTCTINKRGREFATQEKEHTFYSLFLSYAF